MEAVNVEPDAIMVHDIIENYRCRPTEEPFHSMSIWRFAEMAEKFTLSADQRRIETVEEQSHLHCESGSTRSHLRRPAMPRGCFTVNHPQQETHGIRICASSHVVVFQGKPVPRRCEEGEGYENWCRAMILLFVPWRNVDDLALQGETWAQLYDHLPFTEEPLVVIRNMQIESECEDAKRRSCTEAGELTGLAVNDSSMETEVDIESLQMSLAYEGLEPIDDTGLTLKHSFAACDAKKSLNTIGELERANMFDLSGASSEGVSDDVELIGQSGSADFVGYKRFMAALKKRKRQVDVSDLHDFHITHDDEQRPLVRRRLSGVDPKVDLNHLPAFGASEGHSSSVNEAGLKMDEELAL